MEFSAEQLSAFYTLARERSFTRTAEVLFRTQPAISLAIGSLENQLGEKLFIREGRDNILTPAGQILFEHMKEVYASLDQAKLRIEALKELREGELKISTSDTTAYYILPEVLKEFRDQYPGIEVKILSRPSPISAKQVLDHEADLGIVTLPIDHPGLRSVPLVIREDVVICAKGHKLEKRKRVVFRELSDYPLLLLDRGSNTRAFIDECFQKTGLAPKIALELGSIEVIKRLVELDFGISIVPHIAVQRELEQGALSVIKLFKRNECRRLGVIYPVKGPYSLPAKTFLRLLRERLS